MWKDIKQELEEMAVKPIMDDRHWMDTSIEEANEQAELAIVNQSIVKFILNKKILYRDQAKIRDRRISTWMLIIIR